VFIFEIEGVFPLHINEETYHLGHPMDILAVVFNLSSAPIALLSTIV
jgi:hypothetical protein